MAKKTFEENMEQMAEIAEALEAGDVPLAEALRLYKDAAKTAKLMKKELTQVKGEMVIVRRDMDGLLTEETADEYEF